MVDEDKLRVALESKRKEKVLVKFFKDPLGVIRKNPIRLGYISGAIGAILILIIYVYSTQVYPGSHPGEVWTGFIAPYDAYILAAILASTPPAYYLYAEEKRIKKADGMFPDLLRDLAQAKRAGLTLIDAVTLTAEGDYGILTEGLQKTANQLTWGVPFEDALRLFAKRYPTRTIKRSVEIIIEGYRVGGDVGEILKLAAEDVNDLKVLEKKRAADMMPYVAICYITFFVFLLILLVLYATLIPMMTEASEQITGAAMGGAMMARVDTDRMEMILFHCAIIQGLCSGFVAGKLGKGKLIAGLQHALILASTAFVLFAVLEFAPI